MLKLLPRVLRLNSLQFKIRRGPMGKVRVAGFGVSIDGFGAGPDQGLEHPLGKGGRELHNWFYPTRTFRSMI